MTLADKAPLASPSARSLSDRPRADPRAARATRHASTYALLLLQLAALWLVFRQFSLEAPSFLLLSALMIATFAVAYWLPFEWRKPLVLTASIGGMFLLLPVGVAALLLASGLLFFTVLSINVSFRVRAVALAAIAVLLMAGRATLQNETLATFWPVLGALFMFRLVIYAYDLKHAKTWPSLSDFLHYFFLVPNYYFLLFPVVDYQTFKASYYRRDINETAQRGVAWIARGAVQLLLYRLVYHLKPPTNEPEQLTTFPLLVAAMVTTYLLYLRVSGQFHVIVGLLHLFGYDLPETHRRFLLAHSLTDFWRRINIYWKDFMVKVFYFPAYFALRRRGETVAQVGATALVFVATWLLHSYQWFWLRGEWLFTWPDTLFWAILGALVIVNVLLEARRGQRRQITGWRGAAVRGFQIAGTFALITTLWFFWNATSVGQFVDAMTRWAVA